MASYFTGLPVTHCRNLIADHEVSLHEASSEPLTEERLSSDPWYLTQGILGRDSAARAGLHGNVIAPVLHYEGREREAAFKRHWRVLSKATPNVHLMGNTYFSVLTVTKLWAKNFAYICSGVLTSVLLGCYYYCSYFTH